MKQCIDSSTPDLYPANIRAILKRRAPAADLLGQQIVEIDVEAGSASLTYQATQSLTNRFGAIHGGMTAAMLDDVISIAAGLTIEWGQITPTLEMKVSYIAQVHPGGTIKADARTVKRGKSVVFVEAELCDEAGKLLATASSTVMIAEHKPASASQSSTSKSTTTGT